MRLVQFVQGGSKYLGLELSVGGDLINLNKVDASLPVDLKTFIESGEDTWEKVKSFTSTEYDVIQRGSVKLLAPLTTCEKVLCIGMNYRDHCEEQGVPLPTEPVVFNKFPSCIIGPNDELKFPAETEPKNAMEYVFGYTAANDITARDWIKKNGGQVTLAKARDQFCPLGPAVVTTNEIGDPHNLEIKCRVNGVLKQDSNTNQLVHKTEQIIAHISRFITLKPGDIVLTGSPPGVGYCRRPPEHLRKGDIVEVKIDKIGTLITKLV